MQAFDLPVNESVDHVTLRDGIGRFGHQLHTLERVVRSSRLCSPGEFMFCIVLLHKQRNHAEVGKVVFEAIVKGELGIWRKSLGAKELVHDGERCLHGVLLAGCRTSSET